MSSWTGDVDDSEESESDDQEESQEEQDFEERFLEAVEEGSLTDIGELELLEGIEEVEDEDALRQAFLSLGGEKQNIVKNRIEDLTGESPEEEESSEDDSEEEESDSSSGWGGSEVDDEEDDAEDSEAAQPSIESAEEIEEQSEEEDSESDEDGAEEPESDSSGPPKPSNAISPAEAAERDRRWKIMVWGPPKLFKTHFAYTMPEPVAFLDLEGKADDLAKKFKDKNVQIWQPKSMEAEPDTKFRRALKALNEALEWLDWHRENEGQTGTIVVDSMSLMWEWAQVHHKLENYPLKDEDEVELSSNFNSSQESDWAVIKEYHNGEFREKITDSPYHFLWTAMERVNFEQTFEEGSDVQIMEPTGEPKNDYKADTIIHARKDPDRGKVGDLTGSNFTDNVFVGLKKPTFPKVRDAVEAIERAESSENPKSRSELAKEIDAETIIDYDPQTYVQQ